MKDAKGHGSNTGTKGMRLLKTYTNGPHMAKVYKNPEWEENVVKFFPNGVYRSQADSHTDDVSDAHATAQFQLQRYVDQDAKKGLASGPKSAPVPTHDAMQAHADKTVGMPRAAGESDQSYIGRRIGYSPDAVNKAIASSNRSGRRIGGREASAIHRLLKGR